MNKMFGLIKLFAGLTILMIGFSFVIGGTAVIVVDSMFTDDNGYFESTDFTVAESGVSILRYDIEINSEPGIKFDLSKIIKFKLELEDSTGEPVFVGLLPTSLANSYLSNSSYFYMTSISEMNHNFWEESSNFDYSGVVVAAQNITPIFIDNNDWIVGGYETNTLYWEPNTNDLIEDISIIMISNSENLDVTFSLGAKVPILLPIGIVMLVLGIFVFILSIFVIVSGVSSLRRKDGKEIIYYVPAPAQTQVEAPKTKVVYVPSTQAPTTPEAVPLKTITPVIVDEVVVSKPKYCPQCGLLNEADSAFCPDCGASL